MHHDADFLSAAITGYQERLKQIDAAVADLRQRLHIAEPVPTASSPARKKHKISRQGRARIAAAQKKRWAAVKNAKATASAPPAAKKAMVKRAPRKGRAKAAKRAAAPKRAPLRRAAGTKPAAKKTAAKRVSVVKAAAPQVIGTPAPATGTEVTV